MRLDLYGFRRELSCGARIRGLAAVGIDIVNRHMWIGDSRLFQIFVHAAAPALVAPFELDRDARAAAHFMVMMGLLIRIGVVRHPFDTMVRDVLLAFFSGWNVFSVTFAVDDLRHVPPRVDLDFEVVRRLPWRSHGNDLHRFARRQHPVHARGADTDSLLSSTHPESMKFRAIEQFSEDERYLFFDNARPVVLDTDLVPIGTRSFDMNPDLGNNARFLASVE